MERWLLGVWYLQRPGKAALLPLTALYLAIVMLRRWLYRRGWFPSTHPPVPVVIVGNITTGGTGKTPLVLHLARLLGDLGFRPGIVSRGYRGRGARRPLEVTAESDPDLAGDEPVLLARRSACPVMVAPDRVAAAAALVERGVDVILSDDGLQHYRLKRDCEIAVVDASRGLGNGYCLPAGPLREPAARLGELDAVVLNGSGWSREGALRMDLRVREATSLGGDERRALESFRGAPVHAVAAIGNPERFFELLREAGLEVIPHPKPDHARLRREDLCFADALEVLITEKDAVKCLSFAAPRLWYVPVDVSFEPAVQQRLVELLQRKVSQRSLSNE